MNKLRFFVVVFAALLAILPALNGQSVTGQISGTVTDSGGAVIGGAKVQLTHDVSKQVREFTSEANGSFIFTGLVPGSYSLHLVHPGFRTYEQKGIVVAAQERVDLHEVRLSIGDINQSVEVSAQTVHVATDSSDRSVAVNLLQIEDTPVRGRDFLATIKALPGVQDLSAHDARGWGVAMPTINGGQMGQTQLNIDGIAAQDSGNLNPGYMAPSIDAIGEVRLVVSNFTAEYGGRTGGTMQVSIKGGSNEFHGSAFYYWRHEQFDANEFFNNAQGVTKPRYRYSNPGGTIGGPLIIPGTNFNKSRTKLFFFFSVDSIRNKSIATNRYTMPTALERAGDFSQTVTSAGVLIPIIDPSTGLQFPGNKIPANRLSAPGIALMNLFPLPDSRGFGADPSGSRGFNSIFNVQLNRPNDDKILRVDYNIGSKTTAYVRLLQDYQAQDGYGGTVNPVGGAWGQFPASYHVQAAGVVGTVVHTFSPRLINELTWGINRGKQGVDPIDQALYQKSLLPLKDAGGATVALPSLFGQNTQSLLPTLNFGFPTGFSAQTAGLPVTGNTGLSPSAIPTFGHDSRWPFVGTDMVQSVTDKVTWIKGSHTLKAGFYYERMARNVAVYETYNPQGTYYFGSDKASPVDTGYPYSNLATGGFFAYGEDNKSRQINHARYNQEEFFVQDTWKVNRRLTIDVGVRFFIVGPLYSAGAKLGIFSGSAYSAAQSGTLLLPALIGGQKMAINPVTLKTYPYVRQGTFDPASFSTNPFSGVQQYDSSFFNTPAPQIGPKIGLAWDVFGNGKTALRTGIGITYGRPWNVDQIGAVTAGTGPLAAPPNLLTPLILNNSIANLAGAQASFTPQNVVAGSPDFKPPAVYNWSFGVQQDLRHGMVLEVSYVGNVAHRIANSNTLGQTGNAFSYDANAVAPLTDWTPAGGPVKKFLDPTSSGGGTGAFYSTNLIRALAGPFPGFGGIYPYTFTGESYYDALQTSLDKRFSKGLQFGVNYTWSKTILYQRYQWVPDQLNKNVTSRPHAVNFNFGYDIPNLSHHWNNAFSRQLFSDWRLYGNGTIFSGSPLTIGCSAVSAPIGYWTGTPTGGIPFRCQMNSNNISDIWLPSGQYPSATADPRLQFPFNKAEFALPPATSLGIGNTPPTLFYGPGVFNVDFAIAKDFHLGGEKRILELKLETFNTLNHFNPGNPNTTLNLNFATGANTNAAFGTITGTQGVDARHAIISARFRF